MDEKQQKQIDQRDQLVRAAMVAVGLSATNDPIASALTAAPRANQDHYAVACAISYLLAEGLIICAADDTFDNWLSIEITEHLRPDPADFYPAWLPVPGHSPER